MNEAIPFLEKGKRLSRYNGGITLVIDLAREFIKRLGEYVRIICLSTDSVQIFVGQIAYGASKAAIETLTRSIAMEVGKYGIKVESSSSSPTA
ncbi:MAG TPA: SDR family oxidoreductase, partial [Thermotogota bacterium]|nr:SDR family oxidoreductase [Thermotogota bacterium]